jgi:hypothetical protein
MPSVEFSRVRLAEVGHLRHIACGQGHRAFRGSFVSLRVRSVLPYIFDSCRYRSARSIDLECRSLVGPGTKCFPSPKQPRSYPPTAPL